MRRILCLALLLVSHLLGVGVQAQSIGPELRQLLEDQSSVGIGFTDRVLQADYSLRVNNGANLRLGLIDDQFAVYPAFYFSGPFAFAYGPNGWEAGYVAEGSTGPLELAGITLTPEPVAFIQLLSGHTHLYLGFDRVRPNADLEVRVDVQPNAFVGLGVSEQTSYLVAGTGSWSAQLGYNHQSNSYEAKFARHWLLNTFRPWVKQSFQEVSFYTRDKVKLYANWYIGNAKSDSLAIILNGFGAEKDNLKKDLLANKVAEIGDALVLDFRGHGHSSGSFTGTNQETEDVLAAIRFAQRQGYKRIALIGFSMGGSVALKSAALFKDDIDGVVTISAPLSIDYKEPRYLTQKITGVAVKSVPFTLRNISGLRIIPPELAANLDVRKQLAEIEQPLLMVHSLDDWLIPVDDAYTIYDSVSSELKQLVIMPGRFHSEFISERYYDEVISIIYDWLREL